MSRQRRPELLPRLRSSSRTARRDRSLSPSRNQPRRPRQLNRDHERPAAVEAAEVVADLVRGR
jgi:hypothetical protein